MSELTNEEWEAAINRPVTVTPQQVANVIHSMNRPVAREHHQHHSCACMHLAMYYLGVTKETGLYWPDGKGGNAWDAPAPNPAPVPEPAEFYAPSSAREVNGLLDAIEQSIRSLLQPLSPTDTATRIKLAADYGLSYVAALRDRLSLDYATPATPGSQKCVDGKEHDRYNDGPSGLACYNCTATRSDEAGEGE